MPSRDHSDYIRRQKYKAIVIGGGQGDIRNRYTDQSSLVAMANTAGKAFTASKSRVPDTPLSLSGDISDSMVILTVVDGGDGGSPLIGYAYAINNSAGDYRDISYNSPFEIDELTNGETYTFYVKARNANGYSVLPAFITLSPATVPDPPTLNTPIAGNQQLTVPFTAPTDTGGRPLTGYKYSVNSGTYTVLNPSSSPLVLTTGLMNGTSYTVRMKATTSIGDSVESNAVSGTPFGPPFAPNITSIAPGMNSLSISFTAGLTNGSAITNYEYSTDNGATFKALDPADFSSPITINTPSSSVTLPLPPLTNGTTYQVKIRAVNAAGAGIQSNMVEGTPSGTTIVSFTYVGTTTWMAPPGVSSVEYLVVGGGGGGGGSWDTAGAGGGGGGMVLTGNLSVLGGEVLDITVGDGGAGGTSSQISPTVRTATNGIRGNNSRIVRGGVVLIDASGGGIGYFGGNNLTGGLAGSGGNGSSTSIASTGGDGGTRPGSGGGGGGYLMNGLNGTAGATETRTFGGNGTTSALYSGTFGEGGMGGFGTNLKGTISNPLQIPGTSGSNNTGNGGGGASVGVFSHAAGGKGGSGIVVLRYTA
jgi:hypothetical protein